MKTLFSIGNFEYYNYKQRKEPIEKDSLSISKILTVYEMMRDYMA